jgi:four helix bundle protein
MKPYERLKAWRQAHRLALAVYDVTDAFPKVEVFELTSQIRRAALSVPTNIAEGSAKRGRREFRRFLISHWARCRS